MHAAEALAAPCEATAAVGKGRLAAMQRVRGLAPCVTALPRHARVRKSSLSAAAAAFAPQREREGDAELLAEVRALLAEEEALDPRLEQPAVAKGLSVALKDVLWRLVALPVEHYGQAEATASTLVELLLGYEHLEALKPFLKKIKPMPAVFDNFWVKNLQGTNVKKGKTKRDLSLCNFMWLYTMITPHGDVIPCQMIDKYPVGNVKTAGFMDIWNGAEFQAIRFKILRHHRGRQIQNQYQRILLAVQRLR
mgnify:CR=1 FL=1